MLKHRIGDQFRIQVPLCAAFTLLVLKKQRQSYEKENERKRINKNGKWIACV